MLVMTSYSKTSLFSEDYEVSDSFQILKEFYLQWFVVRATLPRTNMKSARWPDDRVDSRSCWQWDVLWKSTDSLPCASWAHACCRIAGLDQEAPTVEYTHRELAHLDIADAASTSIQAFTYSHTLSMCVYIHIYIYICAGELLVCPPFGLFESY